MWQVLIISNHHRRCCFFESTMRKLYRSGIEDIWIQDTGSERWGSYQGPRSTSLLLGNTSYDQGMRAARSKKVPDGISHVVFIDNDCFLEDAFVLESYLDDFNNGQFDFACHFVSEAMYHANRKKKGSIYLVEDMTFHPTDAYPFVVSEPHFENTMMVFTRELWEKLTPDEVSHGRLLVKSMHDKGAIIGGHEASYRLNYSHFGPGWFHVGNLMAYYYALEQRNFSKFQLDSELDLSRLGFFYAHESFYPREFPVYIRGGLDFLRSTHEEKARSAWAKLTKGTCMEKWIEK